MNKPTQSQVTTASIAKRMCAGDLVVTEIRRARNGELSGLSLQPKKEYLKMRAQARRCCMGLIRQGLLTEDQALEMLRKCP